MKEFEIIDFRVKKKQDEFLYYHHYPQIKLRGLGWYYIIENEKHSGPILLLKHSWCISKNFKAEAVNYTYHNDAQNYRSHIKYIISYMRLVMHNKKFIYSLDNNSSIKTYMQDLENFVSGTYYTVPGDIKISFLRL